MKQSKKNTLSSLTGFPVKPAPDFMWRSTHPPGDALQGLATGNRKGKPAEREQHILTPDFILEVPRTMWDEIQLDPCAAQERLFARENCVYPLSDGLKRPWVAGTFINPPYKYLQDWLAHGLKQPPEQIWLVPNRTHRKWYRSWRDRLDAYVELDPIKFEGWTGSYPAPLILGYVGNAPRAFRRAVQHLKGDVYVLRGF